MNLISANFDSSYCINCDFSYSDFSHAFLENCNAQKSYFNSCKFFKTNLNSAKLQYAYLSDCDFSNLDVKFANFEFSCFDHSYFGRCNFSNTNFSDCSLTFAKFKESNFTTCNLNSADFTRSIFENCSFHSCTLNSHTFFYSEDKLNYQIIESILLQSGIWDDDPEWLVGKIQNENLLERIRKEHAQCLTGLKTKNKDWDAY